jgi:hypothetical protein
MKTWISYGHSIETSELIIKYFIGYNNKIIKGYHNRLYKYVDKKDDVKQ